MTAKSAATGMSRLLGQCYQLLLWVGRRGPTSGWMVLALWAIAIAPARAELELRVAIARDVSQVTVGSSTDAVVKDGSNQELVKLPAMNSVVAEAKDGAINVSRFRTSGFWIEPSNGGSVFIGDKWYRGRTLVLPTSSGKLTAVNYVDLEHYLYSVVGSEMYTSWPLEALKAQAVAARSYVLYQRQTSANTVFDVGDTTAWQKYNGMEAEAASTRAAVDATQGQVLTYGGQIIDAVFHACAGGQTENSEDVWTNALPYLRGVESLDPDVAACRWERRITADEMKQRIGGVGNIINISPVEVSPTGRIERLKIIGDAGDRIISGREFRQALDLRSTPFLVAPQLPQVAQAGNPSAARPVAFQMAGRGFGHGIGMSQWGAYGYANTGWNYAQILLHYYTGTELRRIEVE